MYIYIYIHRISTSFSSAHPATPRSPTSLEFMSKLSKTSLQRTASAIAKAPRLAMRFLGLDGSPSHHGI